MIKASLRSHLTLWFAGLSLVTLLSVGLYVGDIATEQMKQASGNSLLSTARSATGSVAAEQGTDHAQGRPDRAGYSDADGTAHPIARGVCMDGRGRC